MCFEGGVDGVGEGLGVAWVVAWWEGEVECDAEDIQSLCKYCINQRELLRPVAAVAVKGRNGIWKRL